MPPASTTLRYSLEDNSANDKPHRQYSAHMVSLIPSWDKIYISVFGPSKTSLNLNSLAGSQSVVLHASDAKRPYEYDTGMAFNGFSEEIRKTEILIS